MWAPAHWLGCIGPRQIIQRVVLAPTLLFSPLFHPTEPASLVLLAAGTLLTIKPAVHPIARVTTEHSCLRKAQPAATLPVPTPARVLKASVSRSKPTDSEIHNAVSPSTFYHPGHPKAAAIKHHCCLYSLISDARC